MYYNIFYLHFNPKNRYHKKYLKGLKLKLTLQEQMNGDSNLIVWVLIHTKIKLFDVFY